MSENKIKCPLVDDEEIEIGDGVIVSSIANECIKEKRLPKEFKRHENWREICENCEYYDC